MRELAAVGVVALLFGLGGYYVSPDLTVFAALNLAAGSVALLVAGALALRRPHSGSSPAARRLRVVDSVWVIAAISLSMAGVHALDRSDWIWDTTADQRYTLSPATRQVLAELPAPVTATLYSARDDNRARATRLLLDTLAAAGPVQVHERLLEQAGEDVDRFGIGSSNTVVIEGQGRFEVVERPSEGTLYEALHRLVRPFGATIYIGRGEGEGRFDRGEDDDYTGLAAALQTEGYTLHDLVMPAVEHMPEDAAALLLVAPRRRYRPESLAAIDRWLAHGGRLVALLEPGAETGLEALLEKWGFSLPDVVVVDPASGPIEGDAPGLDPVVFEYASHPITRGLGPTDMLFFRRARPVFPVHKPEPDDEVRGVVYSSRRAWLSPDVQAASHGLRPARPADAQPDYQPLVSVGRYPRGDAEGRIAIFGDADFASNRYLRALYNLDVVLNTMDWITEHEDAITVRPKSLTPDQFPLTPQQSLRMLFGVGLVIPELCLVAAALTWVRRRSA